ncbi:hypothetical protein GCM10023196_079580 [Actinoallomurus vinaceus]|uniref:Uncharacterized protein n=1 Tax=Actinoallomurus vinaceus TaxID=1080074 RepID=A0ABP8UP43_9ACTN
MNPSTDIDMYSTVLLTFLVLNQFWELPSGRLLVGSRWQVSTLGSWTLSPESYDAGRYRFDGLIVL